MATPYRVLLDNQPNRANKRRELADFLKARRARIIPQEVGLPKQLRSRTPGLRREDVAELAGISVVWYTWLEQAREINVSTESLSAIAAALRLNSSETKHLFNLADKPFSTKQTKTAPEIPVSLRAVLNGFAATPAFVMGRYLDILAWNTAAEKIFGDFLTGVRKDKNWVKFVFAEDNREFFANWEDFARCTLAVLRADYGRYLDVDKSGERLLGELETGFPEFQTWWQAHDVLDRPHARKEFCHPEAGLVIFDSVTLFVEEETDFRVVVYAPADDSDTRAKLDKLLKS